MTEPYSEERAEIARRILTRTLDEMFAEGFDVIEAAHALCREGIDLIAMEKDADQAALAEELGAVIEACEKYLEPDSGEVVH